VENKPLITIFVYPITFALRFLLLFNIFSSEIANLIASLVITLLGLVILIVFFGTALIGLKKVKNKVKGVEPSKRQGSFCANCGAKIDRIASFCPNCGRTLE
jgi:hypothetical protein